MDKQKLFDALDERIEVTLDLGEFHERLAGQTAPVWLNPPRAKLLDINKIEDKDERGIQRIGLQLGLTPDEARTLFSKDAAFCDWLVTRVVEMTNQYSEGRRKKSATD